MTDVTRQTLIDALYAVIEKAPATERNALAQALEDYAGKFSRSYNNLTKIPFTSSLLDCIEEASDARLERDRFGHVISNSNKW